MSYKVYPVINCGPECDDYTVLVNGKEVALNTARVSAYPFNRRWPGHQRQIEQSETVQFLSLATDEPLEFTVKPKKPFTEVKIRPKSLRIEPRVSDDGTVSFTLHRAAHFTVEPYGRSRALHIFADPMKDYGVRPDGEGVIYFGAGEHHAGVIEMKSNQTLYLDEGAVVYACVYAKDAENIRILGRGILDNSENKEQILFDANVKGNDAAIPNAVRRHTVQLEYCTGIEIDGITMRDSLVYNIRPMACSDIKIKNVKIIGCWRFNSDGIDMHNCVNVRISDCFIRTFDDSICIKGFDFYNKPDVMAALKAAMYRNGKVYDLFKNVTVEDTVIWNDWGKTLEIGAETKAREICDVTFRNCDIIHLAGAALDCMNVDNAHVHGITFTDIGIEADEVIPTPMIQTSDEHEYECGAPDYMPPTMLVSVEYHHEYSKGSPERGRNSDFLFKNIRVYGDKLPSVVCFGFDEEHKTEGVVISGLYLNGELITELPASNWQIGDFTDGIRLVGEE